MELSATVYPGTCLVSSDFKFNLKLGGLVLSSASVPPAGRGAKTRYQIYPQARLLKRHWHWHRLKLPSYSESDQEPQAEPESARDSDASVHILVLLLQVL